MLTKKQIENRKSGIGGSDASIVAGLSSWKTPVELYLEKIGEREIEQIENERIYFGNLLEPVIREEYCRRTGHVVKTTDETFTHQDYPWMLAHVDGLIYSENAILECKTASAFVAKKWGIPGTDEIPEPYLMQCAHYAAVCNVDRVDIAVLIDNSDFRIYTYRRSPALERGIIEIESKFWNEHVLKRIPPEPINGSDSRTLWPEYEEGKVSIADDDDINSVHDLMIMRQQIKDLKDKEQSLLLKLQNKMRDSSTLIDQYTSNKLATWSNTKTTRINTKLLRENDPEIYEKYCSESTSRVFKLNKES